MLLMACFANTKWCKKAEIWLKHMAHGYLSERFNKFMPLEPEKRLFWWYLSDKSIFLDKLWMERVGPNSTCYFPRNILEVLTLPMLRLFSSKAQWRKTFWKTYKPCHVGIHWIALTEYPITRVYVIFQVFCIILYSKFSHYSSIRVKEYSRHTLLFFIKELHAWIC